MKRALAIITITMALALTLASCASKEAQIPDNVGSQEIAAAIMAEVEIPSAVQKGEDEILIYIDLDLATIDDVAYYICGSGGYPDELLIIRFSSPQAAINAQPAVQARLDSRKDDFRDYRPDEMYKLDGAVLETDGNRLFYLVTEDNDKAKEILDGFYD